MITGSGQVSYTEIPIAKPVLLDCSIYVSKICYGKRSKYNTRLSYALTYVLTAYNSKRRSVNF